MSMTLGQLLNSIHPARTRETFYRHADEAIAGFRVVSNIITDAIQYREILCRFVQHVDHHLGLVPVEVAMPKDLLWQRACSLLKDEYGPHGDVASFEIQRAGTEGGLYAVLRKLAIEAARQKTEEDVSLRIDAFCQRLSADEYLAAGEEYMRKQGHLLPAEMSTGSSTRARLNLAGLLKQHHEMLVSLSRLGRQ